jgi:hypothetical protein
MNGGQPVELVVKATGLAKKVVQQLLGPAKGGGGKATAKNEQKD